MPGVLLQQGYLLMESPVAALQSQALTLSRWSFTHIITTEASPVTFVIAPVGTTGLGICITEPCQHREELTVLNCHGGYFTSHQIEFICLLEFYGLATPEVISGWVPTCDMFGLIATL